MKVQSKQLIMKKCSRSHQPFCFRIRLLSSWKEELIVILNSTALQKRLEEDL